MTTTSQYPASDKQVSYVRDLFDKKNLFADPRWFDAVNAMDSEEYDAHLARIKDQIGDPDDRSKPRISSARASELIDHLKELPNKDQDREPAYTPGIDTGRALDPEAGMYRLADGTVVRVYLGQNSGRMLAKKLVDTGRPHPEDSRITVHEYEYMGMAQRFVNPNTQRLTLAEAKEFGRMSGSCCICARRLDVPESVEAGIGPVCAKRVS